MARPIFGIVLPVRIYTTTYCGYCHAAKALLHKKGIPFEEIDCTDDPDTRRRLVEQTGRRTVPQIFVGEVPIGGCDDLRALERAGRLDDIVNGRQPAPSVI